MKELVGVSLFGKHPSSSEYLYFGENSSFTSSIISWVKQGYEALLKSRKISSSNVIHNLYFCNKEIENIVCASLKISRDSKGREYPLIILVEMQGVQQKRYFKDICKINSNIFMEKQNSDELNSILEAYKTISFTQSNIPKIDTEATSAFLSEDFSTIRLFYKSLVIDDFIDMMR